MTGPGAAATIGLLTKRPLDRLGADRIYYAVREDGDAALVSDLTIWRHGDLQYEVMSGRRKDIEDLAAAQHDNAHVTDLSQETAIFALQGPGALRALDGLVDTMALAALDYFAHCRSEIAGVDCIVGRLGYSGEAGLEIILPRERAAELWDMLSLRARPSGFAAADILRIEAGFILFANEFRLPVSAREAGLERFGGLPRDQQDPEIALVGFPSKYH